MPLAKKHLSDDQVSQASAMPYMQDAEHIEDAKHMQDADLPLFSVKDSAIFSSQHAKGVSAAASSVSGKRSPSIHI